MVLSLRASVTELDCAVIRRVITFFQVSMDNISLKRRQKLAFSLVIDTH